MIGGDARMGSVIEPLDREPAGLEEIPTPAAVVDLARLEANLERMAGYARTTGLELWPHTKTHKSTAVARAQIRHGAAGLTVATVREAEVMSGAARDVLLAHPPVGPNKLERLLRLAEDVRLTVAVDSEEALARVSAAASATDHEIGVLIELDVGMRRVGVGDPGAAAALAARAQESAGIAYRGIMYYPGHIREPVDEQAPALARLRTDVSAFVDALERAGVGAPRVVSGGSTPTAFQSHEVGPLTAFRPGTYVYNDRTTAAIGACRWEDCAYTVLATVVSTAVSGQAVVDAGSKALSREELRADRGEDRPAGYGALVDRPEVIVKAVSEEHGLLDLTSTSWRPRIGEHVRIVPNHVCVSVNLHTEVWALDGEEVKPGWPIAARGWI